MRPKPTYKPKERSNQHGRRAQRKLHVSRMPIGSRHSSSVLSPHKADLREWFAQELPFDEILLRLKKRKLVVSRSALSAYRKRMQREQLQEIVLDRLASGAVASDRVERELARNPAPEMSVLIGLLRNLIFTLTTRSQNAMPVPAIVELMRPVMEWVKVLEKRADRELEREKFAFTQKSKIELGLDAIEAEVRGNAEAAKVFARLREVIRERDEEVKK